MAEARAASTYREVTVPQPHKVMAASTHRRRRINSAKLRHARAALQFAYNYGHRKVIARTHQARHIKMVVDSEEDTSIDEVATHAKGLPWFDGKDKHDDRVWKARVRVHLNIAAPDI